jgi:hypothetical protein
MGEKLSRLIALGFEIYHDVPFDKFNVDHVLVGGRECLRWRRRHTSNR